MNLERVIDSQDLFIFSSSFPIQRMAKAVIGRRKIDSYVLYFVYLKKYPIIDISRGSIYIQINRLINIVLGIHQGRDTYNQHIKNHKSKDFYYNSDFYNDRNQKMASLSNCLYRFRMCDYGAI